MSRPKRPIATLIFLALASGLTTLHGASSGTSYDDVMRELKLAVSVLGSLRGPSDLSDDELAPFVREGPLDGQHAARGTPHQAACVSRRPLGSRTEC